MDDEWVVLGISGVTCGGKTTLAKNLVHYFSKLRGTPLWNTKYFVGDVRFISQDDYFLSVNDPRHVVVKELKAINFELITSLDMKKMLSDITVLIRNRKEEENITHMNETESHSNNKGSFAGCSNRNVGMNCDSLRLNENTYADLQQQEQVQVVEERTINILIVEGFTIFNVERMNAICNIKFHIHLPYEKCYERRRLRTYEPADVPGYFEICVWPHYEQNYENIQQLSGGDIILLNGETSKQQIFLYVLKQVRNYIQNNSYGIYPPAPKKLLSTIKDYCSDLNTFIPNQNI